MQINTPHLSKLQYISQGDSALKQEQNIRKALDHGADWIQLRWKKATRTERLHLSEKIKILCQKYQAHLIINDAVTVARSVDADGVHLGLDDESIENARAVLGQDKIIGGTANTLQHVLQRVEEGCDYIGLGPFQFTATKQNLSPVLGLEGYRDITIALREKNRELPPVFAIGGITLNDIEPLKNTGIYGVALSGVITQEPALIPQIQNLL